ncbi:MAG TPA: polyphosphate kinase 2 family protein [Bryobacteraceae bacterium]|nr:polyphosphate kinase 2 family protein [Bryobacteraceae bacterium]
MLEKLDLDLELSHHEYKLQLPGWQRRLYDLEKACWDNKIGSVVVFEGWDASGKGSTISTLTARLDPRGFKLHSIQAPRTFEKNYPWLWRFWQRIPNYGEMAIFDRSWYGRVLVERVEKLFPESEWRDAYRDIVEFERMLPDDGIAIVKFWLHISKKEQKRRFKELEDDPLESWRVTKEDWKRHRKYKRYLEAAEEMIATTDSEYAPWTIVEATCWWYARSKVFKTLIAALEARLGAAAPATRADTSGADNELREAMERAETATAQEA